MATEGHEQLGQRVARSDEDVNRGDVGVTVVEAEGDRWRPSSGGKGV
jgi:hypothetical protein